MGVKLSSRVVCSILPVFFLLLFTRMVHRHWLLILHKRQRKWCLRRRDRHFSSRHYAGIHLLSAEDASNFLFFFLQTVFLGNREKNAQIPTVQRLSTSTMIFLFFSFLLFISKLCTFPQFFLLVLSWTLLLIAFRGSLLPVIFSINIPVHNNNHNP